METFLQDIRYGWRWLAQRPGFTITAVLALALGVGASTAMFSLLDRVVLRPLPYPDPQELVMIWETKLVENLDREPLSPVNFHDYRGLDQVFEDAAAWWKPQINLTDDGMEPIRVETIEVSGNFFSVVGVEPTIGRSFPPEDGLFSTEREAVISHRLWRTRYGADREIVGRVLLFNDRPYTVVGIMPSGFHLPADTDVWQRLSWDMSQHSRRAHFMEAIGRLKPDVSLEQANRELSSLGSRLGVDYPASNKDWSVQAVPLHGQIVGVFNQGLLILFGAVTLLLFLACANVANMLLARGAARNREVAVRSALGAGYNRLFRQLLTESLMLGSLGAALGLLSAYLGLKLLAASSLVDIPRLEGVGLDLRILAFTAFTALLTTLLFGVVPALQLSRSDLQSVMKEAGRSEMSGRKSHRLRGALVVAEVALSIVLLVGSGLLIRSFIELLREDPGFNPVGRVTTNIELPSPRQRADWPLVGQFFDRLIENLNAQPMVKGAGASGFLPLENGWRITFLVKGRPPIPQDEEPRAQYVTVTPGYFRTLGIDLLRGRDFDRRDTSESPGVVLINRQLAERHWPGQDPVGDYLISRANGIGPLARSLKQSAEFQVIGVVADTKNNSLKKDAEPAVYFVNSQFPYKNMNLVVTANGDSAQIGALIREEVRRLDPKVPVADVVEMEGVVAETRSGPRFIMLVMTGFGALALVLASLGIYGVLSYAVSERTREMGIRMVLGAEPGKITRLVVGEGLLLAGMGILIGTGASWLLSRLVSVSSLLYKVDSNDWLSFAAAVVGMLLVSALACYAPAHRAARLDPQESLREE